jgi:hypothetical protein
MTTPKITIGDRLLAFWESLGLPARPGVSADEIAQFEARYGVVLPQDLRQYYSVVDGVDGESMVRGHPFRFWPLREVKPVSEDMPEEPLHHSEFKDYFLFADYSLWACAYAVKLTKSRDNRTFVVMIGGDVPVHLAGSFEEFVQIYLGDPARLT